MKKRFSPTQLRRIVMRLFLAPPWCVALLAALFVVAQSGFAKAVPFLAQVAGGLAGVAMTAYLLAPLLAGVSERFSFRSDVLTPFAWITMGGLPIAAFTGVLFSGVAQRVAPQGDCQSSGAGDTRGKGIEEAAKRFGSAAVREGR